MSNVDHADELVWLVQGRWNQASESERDTLADIHNAAQMLREERDKAREVLAVERARVVLLQKTCWLALKVNADVTTKREGEPGYYANVEAMYAAVRKCEEQGLLPPGDMPDEGEVTT